MPKANTNKLVAVVFDDPYKAEEARAALHRMGGEGLLEIDETALIAKYPDGRTRVSQDVNIAANGEKIGHIAGLLDTGAHPVLRIRPPAGPERLIPWVPAYIDEADMDARVVRVDWPVDD